MYRTIVAGCNGRERGRGAVALAYAIASATGARLLLVGPGGRDEADPVADEPAGRSRRRPDAERTESLLATMGVSAS
jgi:hypothetical protein